MTDNVLKRLSDEGVAIWLDDLSMGITHPHVAHVLETEGIEPFQQPGTAS